MLQDGKDILTYFIFKSEFKYFDIKGSGDTMDQANNVFASCYFP